MKRVKKEKSVSSKGKKNKEEPLLTGEMKMIGGWIVGLVIIFLLSYFLFANLGKVKYEGLVFNKDKFGNIPIYTYSYSFKDKTGTGILKYNFYTRTDPSNNDVPVNGEIFFPPTTKFVYLSINGTGIGNCRYNDVAISQISIAGLSAFLVNNQYEVRVGTPDENEANTTNSKYVSCEKYPEHMVISIQKADETRIYREDNCYHIDVAECQILEAIEKFEVESLADARRRAIERS